MALTRSDTTKRYAKRTKAVVPVRLWMAGSKDIHLAHTLDVSKQGVRLGGYRGDMKVGDKIEIQYHRNQAQFRIAWITAPEGSSDKQIGAECLEPGKQLWGSQFLQHADY
jgi:hypothetical protein